MIQVKYFFIICWSFFFSCTPSKKKDTPRVMESFPTFIPLNLSFFNIDTIPLKTPYHQICHDIKREKSKNDSLSTLLETALMDKIFPYWYGTPWDFNGHTNVPQQGEIACGYFVSTTLKHIGFNLNRYKLAQQLPIHEAQTLSLGQSILEIQEETFDQCLKQINDQIAEGIYFVGLASSHVGFLLKRQSQLFFIHSNYRFPAKVIIEPAESSEVFKSFSHFYIAALSTNLPLLNFWKKEKRIPIITSP